MHQILPVSHVKEIVSLRICVIPGAVHVVVLIVELYDVPGMKLSAPSDHKVCRNTQLLHQILERLGISAANRVVVGNRAEGALIQRVEHIGYLVDQSVVDIFLFFIISFPLFR